MGSTESSTDLEALSLTFDSIRRGLWGFGARVSAKNREASSVTENWRCWKKDFNRTVVFHRQVKPYCHHLTLGPNEAWVAGILLWCCRRRWYRRFGRRRWANFWQTADLLGKVVYLTIFHVRPGRWRLVQLHFYAWLWSPDLNKKSFKTWSASCISST